MCLPLGGAERIVTASSMLHGNGRGPYLKECVCNVIFQHLDGEQPRLDIAPMFFD